MAGPTHSPYVSKYSPRPSAEHRGPEGSADSNGKTASVLPAPNTFNQYKQNKQLSEKGPMKLNPRGESGRRGIHPWHFLRICFRSASKASTLCNLLWPFVPAALAVQYSLEGNHLLKFSLLYVAMVPCANLVGFAGQELAQKMPHVFGVLTEITFGSIVEIILFVVLLVRDQFYVIKAAILGSILATMLLCLGFCFFVGGFKRVEQTFSDAISETGSGLLLTAGAVLAVPTLFRLGLSEYGLDEEQLSADTLNVSRIIAVLLIIAYAVFVFFQVRTHHGIYDAVFEYDEHRDADKAKDMTKDRLTLTECLISLAISLALVTVISINLVLEIHHVISESSVSDPFMGLILVPLVEKFAEHLTAIDEAWDNQMNFALSHVLGATIQTTLFNGPLTVVIGWGLNRSMDLQFEIFNLAMLILAILTVGRFLQDQKSDYLEGFLCVTLYVAIAVSAWFYPNPVSTSH
ncbi:unnamed protein product [Clonostachys rosea]|uniref:Vacuolar calcium ion transporter n=1 Tax=Bionectria ochroleuca TaxID=29856 RepID=A0ABY6UV01_BIOOC|nr:unnamed protein product [Clonostachys rosea]